MSPCGMSRRWLVHPLMDAKAVRCGVEGGGGRDGIAVSAASPSLCMRQRLAGSHPSLPFPSVAAEGWACCGCVSHVRLFGLCC